MDINKICETLFDSINIRQLVKVETKRKKVIFYEIYDLGNPPMGNKTCFFGFNKLTKNVEWIMLEDIKSIELTSTNYLQTYSYPWWTSTYIKNSLLSDLQNKKPF
jgi:hypothetical protein